MVQIPRKSLTDSGPSPYQYFRVDKDTKKILNSVSNKSKYIREAIKSHFKNYSIGQEKDSQILKALFPYFAIHKIKTEDEDLNPEMISRLMEIGNDPTVKKRIRQMRRLNRNVL